MFIKRNQNGFALVLVFVGVVLLAVAGIAGKLVIDDYHRQRAIVAERATYEKLDSDAKNFVAQINTQYPGVVTHEQYCQYSSAEFGRGPLGCNVGYTLDLMGGPNDVSNIIQLARSKTAELNWGYPRDATKDPYSMDKDLRLNLVFGDGKKRVCGLTIRNTTNGAELELSCSGSALAEHYPVKQG